ncbi:MAG TPA: phage major capsid protein [Gammaproteobacteria bacterium]
MELAAEIKTALEEHGAAVKGFADRIGALEKQLKDEQAYRTELEAKMNRPGMFGTGEPADERKAEAELKAAIKAWYPGRAPMVDSLDYRAYKSACDKYLRYGAEMLSAEERKAMSVGTDPDGGYLVTPDMSGRVARKVFESSPIRQFANVQPVGSDRLEGIEDTDEADSGWVGETQARTDTDTPQVGKYEIPVHEIYAQPKATQKLIDDSAIDIEAWLSGKVSDRFARQEAAAFVNGNGVARPRGLLTYPTASTSDATRPWGTVQYIPTGDASGFITPSTSASPADCLITTVYSLKAIYRTGARWFMNSATAGVVRKFKDSEGRFAWTDSLTEGQPPLLLGYPVSFAEDMPDVGANAFPIMFGNLSFAYTIADRLGIRVLRDPYTSKPYVRFYSTKRVGGAVTNTEAYKLVKVAAS